jgi:hypothetical protein
MCNASAYCSRGSMGRTTRHSAAHCSSALGRDFFYHRCIITVEQCLCEIEVKMCLESFIAVLERRTGPLRLLATISSVVDIGPFSLCRSAFLSRQDSGESIVSHSCRSEPSPSGGWACNQLTGSMMILYTPLLACDRFCEWFGGR